MTWRAVTNPTSGITPEKALKEAIQAERTYNRQKIVNAEEKILDLEQRLILKEKECCQLKEKLLYEHQRQTMEMAQGLVPSYYCEPQVEGLSEQPYTTYNDSTEQPFPSYNRPSEPSCSSADQSSARIRSYENAFQQGWTDFPKAEPPSWTNLSADAQEFNQDSGQNS